MSQSNIHKNKKCHMVGIKMKEIKRTLEKRKKNKKVEERKGQNY